MSAELTDPSIEYTDPCAHPVYQARLARARDAARDLLSLLTEEPLARTPFIDAIACLTDVMMWDDAGDPGRAPFTDAIRCLASTAEWFYPTTAAIPMQRSISATDVDWPKTQHIRLHFLAQRDGGWSCQMCGIGLIDVCSDDDMIRDAAGKRLIRPDCSKLLPTFDHIVPRDLGGSDAPGNLRLACRHCNSSKGAS